MICEAKTPMQLPLADWAEGLVASPGPTPKSKLDEETRRTLVAKRQREAERRYRQKHRVEMEAKRKTPEARKRMAEYMRQRRSNLTESQKEQARETYRRWSALNKEKRNQQKEASRRRHWDRVLKNSRDYRKNNLEKVRKFFREYLPAYRAEQRLKNPQFLLADRMRSTLKRGLRAQGLQKKKRTEDMVGCTMAELKNHIERQFTNGMRWDLPHTFNLDHVVPIIAFDLTDSEERYWSFNWRNLRPLDPIENKRKSDTLPTPLPAWLPAPIAERILSRQIKHPLTTG